MCEDCINITEHFRKTNPEKQGYGLCESCAEESGIVFVDLPFIPMTPRRREYITKEEAMKMFPENTDVLDKDGALYFMTEMTQEEFEERSSWVKRVNYSYNQVQQHSVCRCCGSLKFTRCFECDPGYVEDDIGGEE
jgi:hypothetical protein